MPDTPAGTTDRGARRAPPLAPSAPRGERLHRHRADVARLIFSVVILVALTTVAELAPTGVRNLTVDLLELVETLPDSLVDGLIGSVQLIATVVPVVAAVYLVLSRRFVLFGLCVLAALLAAGAMQVFGVLVEESIPFDDLDFDRANSWFIGSQYPSSAYLAALTASLVAASPWLARWWRRAGWVLVFAAVTARALTATEVPLRNAALIAIGAAAGSAALVIVGAPRRRLDPATIRNALWWSGLDVSDLDPVDNPSGITTFVATDDAGCGVYITCLGRDQRDTDLLLRIWRRVTVRGLSSEAPMVSPRRSLEHDALAMGLFGSAGVRVPSPLAVLETTDEAAVLAVRGVGPTRLVDVPPEDVDDTLLDGLWRQVSMLQHRRFAHGALNATNVVVDDGESSLVDLRLSDLEPSDEVLGADVAELLVSTALIVGVDRAVDRAVAALETEHVVRAVPLLQRAVLSPQLRARVRHHDELIDELRDRLADAAGIEHVELTPVQRITVKGIVSLAGSIVLAAYVFNLAANWDETWQTFTEADFSYIPPIIVLMICTYLAGAWSLMGATLVDLSFTRTSAVMFGQSFLNRFTPANAGGMAMRVRYLQLEGVDGTVAGAAIGMTSGASGIAQGVLIVVFLIWGGASDRFSDFQFPDIGTILIVILVVGLLIWFVLATTWGRSVLRPWLTDAIGKVTASFGDVLRSPRHVTRLFGGATASKLTNIVAFWLSVLAFDVTMSFPKAGALYMIANTLGSAVPTPGGVGGVEAALTASLISFGVDNATAAAIVLLFRTLTFWLPTLPGYFFMRYTQKRGIV